jgi:hypothetical protein
MHCALRFREFEREWFRGKALYLSLMFRSAVRALKVQHIGPDTGQGGIVDIKLKINRLSGLTAPTAETTHWVARGKQSFLRRSFLAGLLASQRVLHAARIIVEHWSGAPSSPLVIPSLNVAD